MASDATAGAPSIAPRGADLLASAFSRTSIAAAILAGVFAVAVPWCELPRDNPLPAEFDAATPGFERIVEALRRHDEACRAADLDGFRATVTPSHLETMRRRLAPIGRPLDGLALRDYAGEPATALAPLLARPLRGARGGDSTVRIVVDAAADAAAGAPARASAHELALEWTGSRFVLDAVLRAAH